MMIGKREGGINKAALLGTALRDAIRRVERFEAVEAQLRSILDGTLVPAEESRDVPRATLGAGEAGWTYVKKSLPDWIYEPDRTDFVSAADYREKNPAIKKAMLLKSYWMDWQIEHRQPKYLAEEARAIEARHRALAGGHLRQDILAGIGQLPEPLRNTWIPTASAEVQGIDRRTRMAQLRRYKESRKRWEKDLGMKRPVRDLSKLSKMDAFWWQTERRQRERRRYEDLLPALASTHGMGNAPEEKK